jgi:uncharacterized LabA/DUF88 family protein
MASNDSISMAVFCDFENVALGVRDANYEKFDIKPVLERLLLKGSIVVKKAYCDWDRYKGFKATMHEANFELIEIPHVRQSGKNSADIRLVVDALDLCYTKSHVNTFVIISGDSDFSPLVSKLRENAKQVIGVGVKQSTSDLLVANCDEFIFYDDLVREKQRAAAKRDERKAAPARTRAPEESSRKKEELEARKTQAVELVVEMFDALVAERGDSGKIWASLLKDTLKRRRPDFNETYYGFRTFGNLLEEAQHRGLLEFGRDEKSGAFVYRSSLVQPPLLAAQAQAGALDEAAVESDEMEGTSGASAVTEAAPEGRQRTRGGRNRGQRGHRGAGDVVHHGEPAWYEPDSGAELVPAALPSEEEGGYDGPSFAEEEERAAPSEAAPARDSQDLEAAHVAALPEARERPSRTRGGRGRGRKGEPAQGAEPDEGSFVAGGEEAGASAPAAPESEPQVAAEQAPEPARAGRGRGRGAGRQSKPAEPAIMDVAPLAEGAELTPDWSPAEAEQAGAAPVSEGRKAPRKGTAKAAAKRAALAVAAEAELGEAGQAPVSDESPLPPEPVEEGAGTPEGVGEEAAAAEPARRSRSPRKGPARGRRGGR